MKLIYNLSIVIFSLLIRIAAPINLKAHQMAAGRRRVFDSLTKKITNDRPLIWVHCASLGEFEQGRPLIEAIKKKFPPYRILLTFFSPSGYEIRKNYEGADYVEYLPSDTCKNAERLIDLIRPEMVFFIKYEFWFNYIEQLKKRNIPLYLVSAIFRPNQLFFQQTFLGKWYRKMLSGFRHFFVQDDRSVELLGSIGIKNVTQSGDTRFDRVAEIANNEKRNPIIEKFKGNQPLIVAGSTWAPDEELLIEFIHSHSEVKFIIAPHVVKQSNIERLISLLKTTTICYSEADEKTVMNNQVIIVDSIGLLSHLYRYANLSYIGGGFGVGIHNTLEAAIFGMPIIFGPNYLKFNEAKMMVSLGIAFPIDNYAGLCLKFDSLLADEQKREQIVLECKRYALQNVGATQAILTQVFLSHEKN